jgi:hypothetical protein
MYTNIKTFEDACKVLNLDAATVIPDFSLFPEADKEAMIAHAKLIIIAKAINGDWTPDWTNGQWDKYYPWFVMGSPSGGGFSCGGYGDWAPGRVSALAFALNQVKRQNMQEINFKTYTKPIL